MIDDSATSQHTPHDEEENYFISMTDMMVGVLFIFIIMLMTFALNFRTQTDVSEEKLRQLRETALTAQSVAKELDALQARVSDELTAINRADEVRAELLQKLKQKMAKAGLKVNIDEISGVLRLTEAAVRFSSDSAELEGEARENVTKIARILGEVLPLYSARSADGRARIETVFVEGHTDKTGDEERNWRLSTERAVNTYRAVIDAAPQLRTLRNSASTEILSVSGYAETRPVPDTPVEKYDVQRRIDLRFVMEIDRSQKLKEVQDLTRQMQTQLEKLNATVEDVNAP